MEGGSESSRQQDADSSGTLPTVRLPLLAESGTAQQGDTQAAGVQVDHDPLADDLDEEDLFGSDHETPAAGAGASAGTPGGRGAVASAGVGPGSPSRAGVSAQDATGKADDLDEKDLFGDDDVDEKELFGSEDEGQDIDEKALFGSDDEQAPAAPAAPGAEAKATPAAPSEPSELDEREIFGDVSDDEPEKVEDVILRRRPAPGDDREFMALRLPNVLSVEKSAFRRDSIPQALMEGYKEFTNTRGMQVVKLLNPENCIRWRFKKGPDGQNLTDEDGRPLYESNSRIVEWEDGTRTLYVGSEAFNMSEITDKVILFEENSQDIHVCHGVMTKRLVATPTSLFSATHESLKRSQFRKIEPVRRSLLLSQEEQAEAKQLYDLEMEQKKRQEARPKRAAEPGAGEITAAFLEEDQPEAGAGPSVLDVKRQYKSQGDAAKRQKRG
uniref:Leo1-like protein n=1 Tax=Alexandrium monilatum TaxID=311494 RepID=A0A7S4SZM1_9DINO